MPLTDEITPSIKPGDDFYAYVNQKWSDTNPIPADKARVGAFTVLADQNVEWLHELFEAKPAADESAGVTILRRFYRAAMDEAAIETAGLGPVAALLGHIGRLKSAQSVAGFITARHAAGRSLVWNPYIEPDDKNSSRYILRFEQSGLGLPDRDYYLGEDARFVDIRHAYRQFLTGLFELLQADGGTRGVSPAEQAEAVITIEPELARASMTAVEKRDVDAKYNRFTRDELASRFPAIDWPDYLRALGVGELNEVFVSQPRFIEAASGLIAARPLDDWRSYLAFHTLGDLLPKLPKAYADLSFDFYGRTLSGTQEQEPRYRRVIKLCAGLLPEPLGELYVGRHFDGSAKAVITDLVANIQAALGRRIDGLDWMSGQTKAAAHAKLATFLPLLGYPDTWRDYSSFELADGYVGGFLSLYAHEWQRDIARLGRPVNRREWLMSPATVNAYYWANTNGIVFPAAILQPPFFDAAGDFAANYGGIGVVIGHEITHGFDDKGSKFDANGNLHSWWIAEDRAAFEARASGLRDQFANYEVEGRKVNGELTLGENIADLGGLLIAFDAMQAYMAKNPEARAELDGFTPEQRFFMSYARIWRGNIRPELALEFLVRDPHAPGKYRTNGGVVNVDGWYGAFNVELGDQLFVAPEARVRIW